jgi:hypoxanthine phosphoribosyltransferase
VPETGTNPGQFTNCCRSASVSEQQFASRARASRRRASGPPSLGDLAANRRERERTTALGALPRLGMLHREGAPYSPNPMRDPKIGEILVQPDDLKQRVRTLGEQVTAEYADRDLLLVGVLKGAVFFLADLMRHIEIPCEVDFMAVSSYGSATDSSGVVRILKDLDTAIEGRHVLIVEDIVDSGLTLQYLFRNLGARNPASLEVCALLTKPERRKVELPIKFVGFEIPDRFAIGYGLDFAERYRNLPYVAALTGVDA